MLEGELGEGGDMGVGAVGGEKIDDVSVVVWETAGQE